MVISRTPYRVSFFGGGTDYPTWYREHGGAVLATTINKYCYLTCRYLPPFFEHKFRVVYSKIETCHSIEEIVHPAVREVLSFLKINRGIEIHHDGDLPARSGIGSSSSFAVGLLHALYALKGRIPSKQQLAQEAIHIEQECLKETVGSQDQTSAAYGGLNQIVFSNNDEITVQPITISLDRLEELESHLMLFYTGILRTASDVAKQYVEDVKKKEQQLKLMRNMVDEGIDILAGNGHISHFGKLLHEAWVAKQSLGDNISNAHVNEIYNLALSAGAIGGKLTGAGGGGFLLLFVAPADQIRVQERLNKFIHIPFKFESAGSQIVFYEPGEDFSQAQRDRDRQTTEIIFKELADIT